MDLSKHTYTDAQQWVKELEEYTFKNSTEDTCKRLEYIQYCVLMRYIRILRADMKHLYYDTAIQTFIEIEAYVMITLTDTIFLPDIQTRLVVLMDELEVDLEYMPFAKKSLERNPDYMKWWEDLTMSKKENRCSYMYFYRLKEYVEIGQEKESVVRTCKRNAQIKKELNLRTIKHN
jgi:hypothetical protein